MRSVVDILIGDERAIECAGLNSWLDSEDGFRVLARASTVEEVYFHVRHSRPDVIFLSATIPPTGGLAASRQLLALPESPQILLFCNNLFEATAYHAIKLGVAGVLSSTDGRDETLQALRRVGQHKTYVSDAATGDFKSELENLTPREFEIFELLAHGLSVVEISDALGTSAKTVGHHYTSVKRKLNLANAAQLVLYAIRSGIILGLDRDY